MCTSPRKVKRPGQQQQRTGSSSIHAPRGMRAGPRKAAGCLPTSRPPTLNHSKRSGAFVVQEGIGSGRGGTVARRQPRLTGSGPRLEGHREICTLDPVDAPNHGTIPGLRWRCWGRPRCLPGTNPPAHSVHDSAGGGVTKDNGRPTGFFPRNPGRNSHQRPVVSLGQTAGPPFQGREPPASSRSWSCMTNRHTTWLPHDYPTGVVYNPTSKASGDLPTTVSGDGGPRGVSLVLAGRDPIPIAGCVGRRLGP